MPHPASIITLLTDFGDRDWFVASMKGVILAINPQATIVDLTHHIGSHDPILFLRSRQRIADTYL